MKSEIGVGSASPLEEQKGEIIETFNKYGKESQDIKSSLRTDNKTTITNPSIGIFFDKGSWSHYDNSFFGELIKSGYQILFFTLEPKYEELGFIVATKAVFSNIGKLSLLIGTNLPQWLANGDFGPVLNLDRTARTFFEVSTKSGKLKLPEILKWADYSALPIRSALNKSFEIEDLILPSDAVRSSAQSYIIPVVPAKLIRLRELSSQNYRNPSNITFAPSVSNLRDYIVKDKGIEIIEHLLQAFKNYNIVFRPRPDDRENKEVHNIKNRFSQNQRFCVDESYDYIDIYANSAAVITDRSSTGQTFTLGTGRPSYSIPLYGDFDGVTVSELRGVGCFSATTVKELIDKITFGLENSESIKKSVDLIYNKLYENCDSSKSWLIKLVHAIINGDQIKNSIQIRLPKNNVADCTMDGYEKSIRSIISGSYIQADIYALKIFKVYSDRSIAMAHHVPEDILVDAAPLYLKHFYNDHSVYSVVSPVVKALISNYNHGFSSKVQIDIIKNIEKVVLERGHLPAIRDFYADCLKSNIFNNEALL